MRDRRVLVLWLALACVPGCGSDPTGPRVAAVVITAPAGGVTIRTLGRTVQFAAEARDASGQVLPGRGITWTATRGFASITEGGLLTAIEPGTLAVVASSSGVASAPLAVSIDPLAASLEIEPDSMVFRSTGPARAVTVVARDSSGALVTDAPTLVSTDAAVARIENLRNVVAVDDGVARVIATLDGLADTTIVTVSLVPASISVSPSSLLFTSHTASLPVRAELRDSASHPITGHAFTFTSADTTVATANAAGVLTPHREGVTDLIVSSGSLNARVALTVHYVVTYLQVRPSPMTFATLNRPQRARLYGLDSTWTLIGPIPDSAAGRTGTVTWTAMAIRDPYYYVIPADTGADVYPVYNGDYGDASNMLNAHWATTSPFAVTSEGYALIIVLLYPATFQLQAPRTDITVGDSVVLTRVARDSLGNDLDGRIKIYYTFDDWSAVTNGNGSDPRTVVVRGVSRGSSWIRMFGGGAQDSVLITVH